MKTWALELNKNNVFDLQIENKKALAEDTEISFVKHNLFCKGRISKFITENNLIRFGSITDFINNRNNYSTAYLFYENQNNNLQTLEYIRKFFNVACARDYKDGLFEKKIIMTEIKLIGNTEIECTIQIGKNTITQTI